MRAKLNYWAYGDYGDQKWGFEVIFGHFAQLQADFESNMKHQKQIWVFIER